MKALLLACASILAISTGAEAACSSRSGVRFGETLGSIATRCGINVQRLRDANPGLTNRTLQNGTVINTPPPQLPSAPPTFRGNRSISGAQGNAHNYHFGLPSPRPKGVDSRKQQGAQQWQQHR